MEVVAGFSSCLLQPGPRLLTISRILWYYEGHCQFGRPICTKPLTSWLMSRDVASIILHNVLDAIYFVKCTSSLLQQNIPHNMMLPHLTVAACPQRSVLSVHFSTGLVSLQIMTLAYQLQLASSQGLLFIFCG